MIGTTEPSTTTSERTGTAPSGCCPIVTISLGQERIFRLRPYGGKGYVDISLNQVDLLVIPAITNQYWTHEVPNFNHHVQKRISITLRAYQN